MGLPGQIGTFWLSWCCFSDGCSHLRRWVFRKSGGLKSDQDASLEKGERTSKARRQLCDGGGGG